MTRKTARKTAKKTARGGTTSTDAADDANNNLSERRTGGTRKRRRWKARRPNPKPEFIFPPLTQKALGLRVDWGWFVAIDQALAELHKRYDAGDRIVLLDAIEVLSGVLFPAWVREGFHEALEKYRRHEVETFDEALGIKRPKGQHLKPARVRELLRWQILFRAYHLHKQGAGKPLDAEMFAAIGRDLNVSTSTVIRIFNEPESDELREVLRNLKVSDMSEIS